MGVTGTRATRGRRGRGAGRPHPGGRARPARSASASGVSNGGQAAEVAAFADGVIVGSAYVRELLEGRGADGVRALSEDLAEGVRRMMPSPTVAAIPSPTQGVWELGPLPDPRLRAVHRRRHRRRRLITEKRWVARGGAPGDVLDIAVWAVPFGIIGGRIYHVITSPRAYFGEGGHPLRAFAIWEGGLGIWGAIALGGVGAWIACRRRGIPLPAFADALAPGPAGRPGDRPARATGSTTSSTAAAPTCRGRLKIYEWDGGRAALGLDGQPIVLGYFHPTFLYELLWNLAAAAFVIWADRRFRLGPRPGLRPLRRQLLRRAGSGSSCCAPTRPSTSSGCGSTCSPRSSSGCSPWPTSSRMRGRPREVIDPRRRSRRTGGRGRHDAGPAAPAEDGGSDVRA